MTRKRGRLTSSYTRNAHNTGRTRMEFVNWASCALHLMQLQQLHGQLHRPVLHAAAACRATRLSGDWDGAGPLRSSLPWVLLQCVRELGTTYQQLPKAASSQQRHATCVALLFCIAVLRAAIGGHGAPPPPACASGCWVLKSLVVELLYPLLKNSSPGSRCWNSSSRPACTQRCYRSRGTQCRADSRPGFKEKVQR